MTIDELKAKIFDEVVAFSGVAEDSIMWDRQKIPVRSLPSIELRLSGPEQVGALNGERVEEFDEATGEVVVGLVQDLEYSLRVQARTVGAGDAAELAKTARRAFLLPSPAARLNDAGIVVVDTTPVLDVGELVETEWQGRAAFTVRIRVGDVEVDPERTTFIETATITGAAT